MPNPPLPRVLTIAGSDSGGGAGIEADLKTFAALRVYGMAAITAVTAQNTVAVTAVHDIPPEIVAAQIDAVAEDIGIDAAKTGMLSNAAIVEAVADACARHRIPNLVVDPVMIAKSGAVLLQRDAQHALIQLLFPLARVITPNIPEADALCGCEIASVEDMRDAAERLADIAGTAVLVKGGHLPGPVVTDILYDGQTFHQFDAPRIDTKNTHGTGCTYAAAIAAYLALRHDLPAAVAAAKDYLTAALQHSLPLGHGHGPLDHGWE